MYSVEIPSSQAIKLQHLNFLLSLVLENFINNTIRKQISVLLTPIKCRCTISGAYNANSATQKSSYRDLNKFRNRTCT